MFWFDGSLLLAAHLSASFDEGVEVRGETDAGFGESATGIEFGVVGPFVSLFIDAHSFAKSDHGAAEGAIFKAGKTGLLGDSETRFTSNGPHRPEPAAAAACTHSLRC
jgi:hypothetical protein